MLAVVMSPPVAHCPAVQKRPKLSLKTSELPITYSTSSRSLSTIAAPNAAVTPTTLNTFNNTFDLTHRPSPTSTIASPSILRSAPSREHHARSQSPRPKSTETVYTVVLPYGIKPILKNTPYPRVRNSSISASPRSSTRRVFFPAPKQVVFKAIIEEPIFTRVYTARHSDLSDHDTESDNGIADDSDGHSSSDSTSESVKQTEQSCRTSILPTKRRKYLRNRVERRKLDLTDTSMPSSQLIDATSAQPAASSRLRNHKTWEWTLSPLPSTTATQPTTATTTTTTKATEKEPTPSSSPESDLQHSAESKFESARAKHDRQAPTYSTIPDPPVAQLGTSKPESETTATQPQCQHSYSLSRFHSDISTSESTNPSQPTSTSSDLRLNPQLPLLPSRRSISLDSTPQRKRKAECLEPILLPSTLDSVTTATRHTDSTTTETTTDGAGRTSQTGPKRRERAATL